METMMKSKSWIGIIKKEYMYFEKQADNASVSIENKAVDAPLGPCPKHGKRVEKKFFCMEKYVENVTKVNQIDIFRTCIPSLGYFTTHI